MAKTTAKAITEGKNFRRYKDGATEYPQWTDAIFQASWSHKCPTYVLRTPPCSGSCPSGHDIRGWLDIVRGMEKPAADQSWQQYAFARMTEANPFPSIMGRVCPAPCEQGCNRNMVEEHIGINSVEHFIGDWAIQNAAGFAAPAVETGKHVAVIGGGPAGLSAAYQLRKRGIAVTLFEANAELGGFMRYGIPGYRVPRDVLDSECKRIIDMGVTVKTDTRVGRDITIAQLEEQFDAVFWGSAPIRAVACRCRAGKARPIACRASPSSRPSTRVACKRSPVASSSSAVAIPPSTSPRSPAAWATSRKSRPRIASNT